MKRENNQYLLAVEKAKSQKRRKEKSKRDLNEAKEDAVEEPGNEKEQLDKMRNRFRQRTVSKEKKEDVQELLPNKQLEFRRKRKRVTNKQAASDEVRLLFLSMLIHPILGSLGCFLSYRSPPQWVVNCLTVSSTRYDGSVFFPGPIRKC